MNNENSEKKKRMSQCDEILLYMDIHGSITALEAMKNLGCMRLASRINDLRKRGYMIVKSMVRMTNEDGSYRGKYAEYHLANEDDLL